MSSATSPAVPAFSYAQAARGLPSGNLSKKNVEQSAASSDNGSRGRQPSSNDGSKADIIIKGSDSKSEVSSLPPAPKSLEDQQVPTTASKDVIEKDDSQPPKRSTSSTKESKSPQSPTVAPSQGSETLANLPKEDDFSLAANGVTDAWERQSEASTSVEKGTQTVEKPKSQNGDDDWEKVSVPSLSQERDLKAAPVPSVNIWTQRKLAQDAKQREQASQRPTLTTNTKSRVSSSGNPDATKSKAVDKNVPSTDKDQPLKRKQTDPAKQGNENRRDPGQVLQARPVPQSTEKLPPPPPVGDSAAWPTPETATPDERRKSSTFDASDRAENKTAASKQHGKKWTQVPFVPTAVFNTPLPPIASKRGGRGANRGGGQGRGGHAAQNIISGDKNETIASMGPPPVPRQGDQDRGRKQDGARDGRATSVPTQGRRSASATGIQTEPRKAFGNHTGSKPARAEVTQSPRVVVSAEDAVTRQTHGTNPSSRPANVPSKNIGEMNDPFVANDNTHAHPSLDNVGRTAVPADWYTSKHSNANGPSAPDPSNDKPRNRELSTRDKVENWRDREPQSEVNIRRESRPERGRGSFRGRGDRAAYGTSYTAPLPQQPFPPNKSQSFHENRQRQGSQPYPLMQPGPGPRQNTRAHSIPVNSPHQMNSIPGMPQPLSPMHSTDMAMAMYAYPPSMHPALLNQMYNPGLEMYSIISMVSTQVEYYFSIDNLCKDVYLRSNMDSQGFVLLHVIAKFKRIDKLTKDIDILRYVCGQSRILEVRQGEDGEDRVRRREGWEQWILPRMEERAPAARNDGPSGQAYQPRRLPYNVYSSHSDASFLVGGQMRSPSWVGGFSDPTGSVPSQITAGALLDAEMPEDLTTVTSPGAVSEADRPAQYLPDMNSKPADSANLSSFVPSAEDTNTNHAPNGHIVRNNSIADTTDQENVFPNEQIPSLWVYARKDEDGEFSPAPPFISNFTHPLSQGSQDGRAIAGELRNDYAPSPFVSGLRGGAGSPEQLQRLRSQDMITFGDLTPQKGTFFLKDGVSQSDFDREASDPWHYQAVYAKAIDQRQQGLQGSDNHEMDILYHFWPTFLIERFNQDMYMDFKAFALDDLARGYTNGNANLAKYYEKLLSENKPLAESAAKDIVDAVARETEDARPVFQKLRSQWRNGAFNLKSRKRIDNLLDTLLRTELEK